MHFLPEACRSKRPQLRCYKFSPKMVEETLSYNKVASIFHNIYYRPIYTIYIIGLYIQYILQAYIYNIYYRPIYTIYIIGLYIHQGISFSFYRTRTEHNEHKVLLPVVRGKFSSRSAVVPDKVCTESSLSLIPRLFGIENIVAVLKFFTHVIILMVTIESGRQQRVHYEGCLTTALNGHPLHG